MAQVDFSNAVLDVNSGMYPMAYGTYMNIGNASGALVNINNVQLNTNASETIILNTPSKVSILFTGAFTTSGTEFYIPRDRTWKVSNISFSANDTYSFVIDIEVSGNT